MPLLLQALNFGDTERYGKAWEHSWLRQYGEEKSGCCWGLGAQQGLGVEDFGM